MINKKISVFFLFFWILGQANAQKAGPASPTPLSGYKSVTIRLPGIRDSGAVQIPGFFHHFEVIDDRMDTVRIGMHTERPGVVGSRTRQLVFPRPAAAELANYLNARYANRRSGCTALVVIRNLWLSDVNYIRDQLISDPDKRLDRAKVRIRMEIYGQKDSVYIPLLRYDSLLISRNDSYKEYGRILADMLDDLGDSSSLIAQKKMAVGKKLNWDDILQFNSSRSEATISHSVALNKGVYKDFAEFKNNSPSISEFELKNENNELFLYLKEAGDHSYYTHNAWGYCDGTNVYVMNAGMLFPAWKEGKAWYVQEKIITEVLSAPSIIPGPGGYKNDPEYGLSSVRKYTQMHVLTVDMDTGTLY